MASYRLRPDIKFQLPVLPFLASGRGQNGKESGAIASNKVCGQHTTARIIRPKAGR